MMKKKVMFMSDLQMAKSLTDQMPELAVLVKLERSPDQEATSNTSSRSCLCKASAKLERNVFKSASLRAREGRGERMRNSERGNKTACVVRSIDRERERE